MEACSKVAASVASVVPFHCVICFEEFTASERPPMVLPCGHTYVCLPCSKRIKRCMECREPLFIKTTPSLNNNHNNHSNNRHTLHHVGNRYSPQQGPSTPPHGQYSNQNNNSSSTNIPLPIPKNLVLLAMMEAAERFRVPDESSSEEDRQQSSNPTHTESPTSYPDDEDDADNTFDLDQIISGMSTLAGPCGTYAVKEKQGLAVIPHHPQRHEIPQEEKKFDSENNTATSNKDNEPFLIEPGQTVQIVEFEDGVAKLARNRGFIVASPSSQLVKVGGPKDNACRLEGLLHTITSRGRDLQKTLDENTRVEENLRQQLADEIKREPSHPIFTSRPLSPPTTPTETMASQPIFLQTPPHSQILKDLQIPDSVSSESIEFDRHGNVLYSSFAGNSPNSIDNADLTSGIVFRQANDDDDNIQQFVFGCGSTFFGGADDGSSLFGEDAPQLPSSAHGRSRAGSDAEVVQLERRPSPRELQAAASFDTTASSGSRTNFRTGMSGHRGLASTGRTFLSNYNTTTTRRFLYSAHTGVSRARPSPTSSPMQSNHSWAE